MITVGIRGAITVEKNTKECIFASTKELVSEIMKQNNLKEQDIASIIFTATPDLDAAFPAAAVREMGLNEAALLDAVEMNVKGSMPRVIRVLMHVNVKEGFKPKHIYLKEAVKLRSDMFCKK